MRGIIFLYLQMITRAKRSVSDQKALAGWCLLHKKSFRTKRKGFGPLSVTRRFYHALLKRSSQKKLHVFNGGISGIAIWDNYDSSRDIRFEQIRYNGGQLPSVFIARSEIAPSGLVAIILAIGYLLSWPWLCLWSVFSKHAENIGLLYDEWNEAYALMQIVDRLKLKHIYFYCPYENDANALFLLLQKKGVYINKIPSPNLLAIANKELLTDELTLTSPCQADELKVFAATMSYTRLTRWLPERFHVYAGNYITRKESPAFSIGLYSHGSWLRRRNRIEGIDIGDMNAEEQFIPAFANVLRRWPHLQCTVFLHPKEKKSDMIVETRAYYDSVFRGVKYSFADNSQPGAMSFDSVDIGVGAISTILFERLFVGCKTIFFPVGMEIFPTKGTEISAICAVTESALEKLILQCAEVSTSQYLEKFHLRKYTVHDWKPGSPYAERD
jgi:hypothetical protein